MSFNSLNYWLIFPFIFVFYWLIPARWNTYRKVLLLAVSYLLYMNWKPAYALILLGVTLITYCGGIILQDRHEKKKLVWLLTLIALIPLLVFKYYNFLNGILSSGLEEIGLHFALPGLNWAVPVGISFFSFQALGYMLDVYHGRVKAEKNIIDYGLFVSFFPLVMSGPICTADELLPQIKSQKRFNNRQGIQGLKYILWGMFIKLVIADRLGLFVDTVYANYSHFNGTTCFIASVFYSLQIYCDFAGYSLMAIGVANTLGFKVTENFRRPYFAISITDFWKRWHITLTRWLTRQIYIPMGGNRRGSLRTYWNILITFLVSGIWHGANWTYIAWGCMHGVFQIVEKALGWQKYEGRNLPVKLLRIIVTFIIVNFAWVFFRMPDIGSASRIIGKMFSSIGMPDLSSMGPEVTLMLFIGLAILMFKDLRDEFFHSKMQFLNKKGIHFAIYVVLFCMILSFGVFDGGSFIYVSF